MESNPLEEGRLATTRWALLATNVLMASVLVWIAWSSSRIFQETLAELRMNDLPVISIPVVATPWRVQVAASLALLVVTVAKEVFFKRHLPAIHANVALTAMGILILAWYSAALFAPFLVYSSAREHRH